MLRGRARALRSADTPPMAIACAACGIVVATDARFCPSCGARQPERAPASREVRKLVTILFADVTGSTALGERLDPEALRALMGRYFAVTRQVIERHGGTVEKFIGDAVMAVFGIPHVHEDDALRAVRAGWEIRAALGALNAELEAQRGISIQIRTGINTGEVVAGDPEAGTTLVTGDTVNTAARLEQAAPPGEILIGRLTHALVRDAIDAETLEPVVAKGKAEAVAAWRLVGVRAHAEGRARHLDAPMVGRDRELSTLLDTWRRVVDDRTPHLVTVVGAAGVGKSRLVRELVSAIRADDGRVLVGRCLSYGEGITYWPIRELVHEAAGVTEADTLALARARVEGIAPDSGVAARVAAAIGLESGASSQEELFWAVRRLLEHLAAGAPTLIVLEDLHWAEDTLLDLVDYVVDLARRVPLMLLATARPDLVERRPAFVAPREATTYLRLEPLGASVADELLRTLPGGSAVPAGMRARIHDAAEGNPLYVEELLALLRDDGRLWQEDGAWVAAPDIDAVSVPVSIRALLAARLEGLPPAERSTAQRASVLGRTFEVAALASMEQAGSVGLTRHLVGLVRKELLRPDRAELTAGDAFRFRHVLIRDAAYEALPKAERAALHERFADWLEGVAGDRIAELEEIVGYHLEQARLYRSDLGESGEAVDRLGHRAAGHLGAAGQHAHDRGNLIVAVALLERALSLGAEPEPFANGLRIRLAAALGTMGRLTEAIALVDDVRDRAHASGDVVVEARALATGLDLRAAAGEPPLATSAYVDLLERARPVVDRSGDPLARGMYWRLLSTSEWEASRFEASHVALREAVSALEVAGDARELEDMRSMTLIEELSGRTPLADVLDHFDTWLARPGLGPESRAFGLSRRAVVLAMLRRDDWGPDVDQAARLYGELGMPTLVGDALWHRSWCERLAGRYADEAASLAMASTLVVPSVRQLMQALVGLAQAKLGHMDAARDALAAAEGDSWYRTRRTRLLGLARVAIADGDTAAALGHADEVEASVANEAYFLNARAEAVHECAVVAALAGDRPTAERRARLVLEIANEKGSVALAARATAVMAGELAGL